MKAVWGKEGIQELLSDLLLLAFFGRGKSSMLEFSSLPLDHEGSQSEQAVEENESRHQKQRTRPNYREKNTMGIEVGLPGKAFPMPVEIDVHPLCNVHTKEHTEEHRHLHIAVFPACNCEHKERDMEDDQAYQPWLCPVHGMNKP